MYVDVFINGQQTTFEVTGESFSKYDSDSFSSIGVRAGGSFYHLNTGMTSWNTEPVWLT